MYYICKYKYTTIILLKSICMVLNGGFFQVIPWQ